jgi:hypothetical protein
MNYPLVMTRPGGQRVETDYGGADLIPTTVVIDRKNNIVRRVVGARTLPDFERYVLPWLLDAYPLRASRDNGKITLEWSTLPASLQAQLEYSDRLPAASWNRVAETPLDGPETTSVSFADSGGPAAPGTARFYRLRITP